MSVSYTHLDVYKRQMLKFINEGFIKQFPDIYHLPEHFDKISSMEGFGEKSCMNMQTAIEKSRHVHPVLSLIHI